MAARVFAQGERGDRGAMGPMGLPVSQSLGGPRRTRRWARSGYCPGKRRCHFSGSNGSGGAGRTAWKRRPDGNHGKTITSSTPIPALAETTAAVGSVQPPRRGGSLTSFRVARISADVFFCNIHRLAALGGTSQRRRPSLRSCINYTTGSAGDGAFSTILAA